MFLALLMLSLICFGVIPQAVPRLARERQETFLTWSVRVLRAPTRPWQLAPVHAPTTSPRL